MNREKQIGEIRQGLAFIQSYISIGRTTNLTDPNIHAEEFVRNLLNILFDFQLINANQQVSNFACIDLIDSKLKLGIQVTSEKGSQKVSKTIECLEGKNMNRFIKNLKIFTLKPKQKRYKINKTCAGINFDWKNDVIDFNDVIQAALNVQDEGKLRKLHSYVIRYTTIFTDYSANIPSLYLPTQDTSLAWLSFSAESTKIVGRDVELRGLNDFLDNSNKFLWWVAIGPAGSGKSRLALELCKQNKKKGWNVGFLSRSYNNFNWGKFRPLNNTLIIVDYVVGRTKEISDLVLELSRTSSFLENSVRVLLLERDTNNWIKEFTREDSLTENSEILINEYSPQYLRLAGLNKSALLEIAKDLTDSRHGKWTKKIEERFIDWMNRDDINCRPLYAMLFLEFPHVEEPTDLFRSVLKREEAKRRKQINGDDLIKFENLLFLSTLVGSIVTQEGDFVHLSNSEVGNLLPDLDILDFNQYFSISCSLHDSNTLAGLRPDLLGELHVLDCLETEGLAGLKYQKLLKFGYSIQPDDVIAFVIKCYQDFSSHSGFQKLFDLPLNSGTNRLTKAKLVAHSSCFPSIIHDNFLQSELENLILLGESYSEELKLTEWIAMSEYNYACTMMFSNRYSSFIRLLLGIDIDKCTNEAKEKFGSVIKRAGDKSQIKTMAQLNLGILLESDHPDESIKMYSELIDSDVSSDETKACALNNRANIYQKRKNHRSAILDREKVLDLKYTSTDRRFVALFGCGESHYSMGTYDKVVDNMTKIIEMDDITEIDKSCTLIIRAVSSYFKEKEIVNATDDLTKACDILLKYVSDKELKAKLDGVIKDCHPKDWAKSKVILVSMKENKTDWVTDILLYISRLLGNNHSKTDKKTEMKQWDELRNLAMSKANRMRVSIPEV